MGRISVLGRSQDGLGHEDIAPMWLRRRKELARASSTAAVIVVMATIGAAQKRPRHKTSSLMPPSTLLQIVRAEDERRWDDSLKSLLSDRNPSARKRAALAAGRIGDERAVPPLIQLLNGDNDSDVRQMAAFAIGEIESAAGASALIEVLGAGSRTPGKAPQEKAVGNDELRARAVEALGKIAAALPETDRDRRRLCGETILDTLRLQAERGPLADKLTTVLALTAALRARPEGAGPVVIRFLDQDDPQIVAGALNVMARLRLKDGGQKVRDLLNHRDPIVRANAARVLGANEDKQTFASLRDRALHDQDLRVRVSAIRALGSLKDTRVVEPLRVRGEELANEFRTQRDKQIVAYPVSQNELLEVVTALGRVVPTVQIAGAQMDEVISLFQNLQRLLPDSAPEIEIAFARVSATRYLRELGMLSAPAFGNLPELVYRRRSFRGVPQGLAEIASTKAERNPEAPEIAFATQMLAAWLCVSHEKILSDCDPDGREFGGDLRPMGLPGSKKELDLRLPEILRAYAAFKPSALAEVLRFYLRDKDVIVRSTAAELISAQTPSEMNTLALSAALQSELPRVQNGTMNDAALAILDALAKQKTEEANDAMKTALDSSDHLLRRRAVALLKANHVGDFSDRIGTVRTRNTEADYRRALARIGRNITATVVTTKGSFTIQFLPEVAPLTVDNFVQLAERDFFNGQSIPRVVPNFVIQAGDPRGDTNGGPGYQIRCEINEVPYERAAVGMALSGKDTGGSQWFVTHSPQPHLDGGYTVFGRVILGMDVVDNISRGDVIRRVIVNGR